MREDRHPDVTAAKEPRGEDMVQKGRRTSIGAVVKSDDVSNPTFERICTMKKFVMTLAAGAALAAAATTAVAHGGWAFDDPYWKKALDRSGEPTVFDRFAAGPRDTLTDAGIEFRLSDDGVAAANEAEKARLEAAGFPQYNN